MKAPAAAKRTRTTRRAKRSPSKAFAAGNRGDIRIGISGWRYEPWRGVFYPEDLPHRAELEYASRMLATVEINGSFYSLQTPNSYRTWHDQTPADFVFAVKGSRYVTHMLRLRDVGVPLANFFASGLLELRAKLGPILWQFPPRFAFDPARFEAFFEMLPHDTLAARELARQHDGRVAGRTSLAIDRKRRLRHAIEVRHESFVDERFVALLRRHRIALVVADTAGKWPLLEDLSADFVYVRLHGDKALYASGYSEAALDHWCERVDTWSRGRQVDDARCASSDAPAQRSKRDVFCYFDNDIKVRAPYDAARLAYKLGLPSPSKEAPVKPTAKRAPRRERAARKRAAG